MNKYHKNLLFLNIIFCIVSFFGAFIYMNVAKKCKTIEATISQKVKSLQNQQNKQVIEQITTSYKRLLALREGHLINLYHAALLFSFLFLINIILIILGRKKLGAG
jgi:hypothetical protein